MSEQPEVLFVTQTLGEKAACGIGIMGDLIAQTLLRAKRHRIRAVYADNTETVEREITSSVGAIIYHYSAATTPWLNSTVLPSQYPNIKHILTHHDMQQSTIDAVGDVLAGAFQYIIADNPLLRPSSRIFTTQRLIPPFTPRVAYVDIGIPLIGFHGFGPTHKGIPRIAEYVQAEFDDAIIRLHIPYGYYGDPGGANALARVGEVRSIITKPGILVEASHDLWPTQQIVDFLAQNTINCYFYDLLPGSGLASSPDFALAARRPIAVTRSHQMRNYWDLEPSVLIESRSLKEIIANGTKPLEPLYEAYSEEHVIADYERILDKVLA